MSSFPFPIGFYKYVVYSVNECCISIDVNEPSRYDNLLILNMESGKEM